MKQFIRYIFYQLSFPIIVITLALTGVIWLTQSLRFIDLIVNRGLGVSTFLYLASLLIPSLLFIILPIGLFISIILVYQRLISESELIVFQSAGISRLQLTLPAFYICSVITLLNLFISFYVLPISYREFKNTQILLRDNYASILLQEGVFINPAKGLTVYIDKRDASGNLSGIFVYDARDKEQPITLIAEEGKFIKTASGPRFFLINGSRQEIDEDSENLSILYFDEYAMDVSVYTKSSRNRWYEAEERFLTQLFNPKDVNDPRIARKFQAEGHYRVIWPLFNFTLCALALAGMLPNHFNRRGHSRRIVLTACFGGIATLIILILKHLMVSQPTFAIILYFHTAFIFMLSMAYIQFPQYFTKYMDTLVSLIKKLWTHMIYFVTKKIGFRP